jgi:hypothetical protein
MYSEASENDTESLRRTSNLFLTKLSRPEELFQAETAFLIIPAGAHRMLRDSLPQLIKDLICL